MLDKRYPLQSKKQPRISQHMSNLVYADMSEAELDEHSSQLAYARLARTGAQYSLGEIELWRALQAIFNSNQPIDHFVRGMDGGRGFGVQRFAMCAQTLDALLNRACLADKRPNKVMRIAMRRFLLDCLYRWLKSANIPASPRAMLQNIDKLEHATDQEFPGYIEAGILAFVLTSLPQSE